MARAILHIGMEKTGTTTLQRFLYQNARTLRSQGIIYPCDPHRPYVDGSAHFPIAASVLGEEAEFVTSAKARTLHRVERSLRHDLSTVADDFIISCEHLSSRARGPRQIERIRNMFDGRKVSIVIYVRDQIEFALSSFSTGVRCGRRDAFDQSEVSPNVNYYNVKGLLNRWANVFGRESLIVRPYSRSTLIGGDIRHDFCAAVGIDATKLEAGDDHNFGLDASQVEVLRYLNAELPSIDEDRNGWTKAQELRAYIESYMPPGQPIRSLISKEDDQQVRERFRQHNAEVSSLYMDAPFPESRHPLARERYEIELAPALRKVIIGLAKRNIELERALKGVQKGSRQLSPVPSQRLKTLRGSHRLLLKWTPRGRLNMLRTALLNHFGRRRLRR